MAEEKRSLNNMNGISDSGKSCGINNMNCLEEDDDQKSDITNMNGISEDKKVCSLNDMNCLNEK